MESGNLTESILSRENLYKAMRHVVQNKGAAGVDGMRHTELAAYLGEHIEEIREEIRSGSYEPQPVLRTEIPKPDGGTRKLSIPTMRDRFVQQAIAQALTPVFEPQFHSHSYAFRPGRCAQQAVLATLDMMNAGLTWAADLDIEKFFDAVDHSALLTVLGQTVRETNVIVVIWKFLVRGSDPNGPYGRCHGIPQGGNISPLLANVMLNELDWELERQGFRFVRYADDCIILTGSRKDAERAQAFAAGCLEGRLFLRLNERKSRVGRPGEIKYLGFGYYKDLRSGKYMAKPHAESEERLIAQADLLTEAAAESPEGLARLNTLLRGWVNYFGIGSMKCFCRDTDRHIRGRLRALQENACLAPGPGTGNALSAGAGVCGLLSMERCYDAARCLF